MMMSDYYQLSPHLGGSAYPEHTVIIQIHTMLGHATSQPDNILLPSLAIIDKSCVSIIQGETK